MATVTKSPTASKSPTLSPSPPPPTAPAPASTPPKSELDPHCEPFVPAVPEVLEPIGICMPCIDFSPSIYEMTEVIKRLGIGTPARVDVVPVNNTDVHEHFHVTVPKYMVFVHMSRWEVNPRSKKIHERLQAGKSFFISHQHHLCKCVKHTHNDP